jgi:hypothetical protein
VKVFKIIGFILSLAPVQGAIVTLFLFYLGKLFVKHKWLKGIAEIAVDSYEFAEEQGKAQLLKGYEKFDPFMDRFIKQFREKYGYDPLPGDKGMAVAVMEEQVKKEHL